MSKIALKSAVVCLIVTALCYGIAAFVTGREFQPNPFDWGEGDRVAAVFVVLCSFGFTFWMLTLIKRGEL
jgi:hypothetical protein